MGDYTERGYVYEATPIGTIAGRKGNEYGGYRVSLSVVYPPMEVAFKIDITIGDRITPKEVSYEFKLLLEDRSIQVLAYNLETVMAEKRNSTGILEQSCFKRINSWHADSCSAVLSVGVGEDKDI